MHIPLTQTQMRQACASSCDLQFLKAEDIRKMKAADLRYLLDYQQLEDEWNPASMSKADLVAAVQELKERGPLTAAQLYARFGPDDLSETEVEEDEAQPEDGAQPADAGGAADPEDGAEPADEGGAAEPEDGAEPEAEPAATTNPTAKAAKSTKSTAKPASTAETAEIAEIAAKPATKRAAPAKPASAPAAKRAAPAPAKPAAEKVYTEAQTMYIKFPGGEEKSLQVSFPSTTVGELLSEVDSLLTDSGSAVGLRSLNFLGKVYVPGGTGTDKLLSQINMHVDCTAHVLLTSIPAARRGAEGGGVFGDSGSGDEFDEDEARGRAATKATLLRTQKAAAKERDAARSAAAKKAKEDAELAVGRRVVREEIMALQSKLLRWKDTTSDDPGYPKIQEDIYKATMLLIGEDKTLKVCPAL